MEYSTISVIMWCGFIGLIFLWLISICVKHSKYHDAIQEEMDKRRRYYSEHHWKPGDIEPGPLKSVHGEPYKLQVDGFIYNGKKYPLYTMMILRHYDYVRSDPSDLILNGHKVAMVVDYCLNGTITCALSRKDRRAGYRFDSTLPTEELFVGVYKDELQKEESRLARIEHIRKYGGNPQIDGLHEADECNDPEAPVVEHTQGTWNLEQKKSFRSTKQQLQAGRLRFLWYCIATFFFVIGLIGSYLSHFTGSDSLWVCTYYIIALCVITAVCK